MPRRQVGELALHYESAGEGEPLVLIHGLGSSTKDWEGQVGVFAEHFRVVAVDIRGHGLSDKPPGPFSVPMFAADTAGLLKELDIGSAHVAGISMGGMIAFQLAVDSPQLLRSMIIVNSGPHLVPATFRERLGFWRRLFTVRVLGMRRMGEVLAGRLFPEPHQAEMRRTLIERWAANDKRAYLASLRAILGWSVADRIEAIQCPTLVIAADQDYTPVAVKEAYAARMPRAEVCVIPNSRHVTPVDQPGLFNDAVLGFLKRIQADGPS